MKKFLLGLLCGVVFAIMAGVVMMFALVRLGDRRPSLPNQALLVLKLEGEIPERAPVEIPLPMFESQAPLTVRDVWRILRRAETDSRVKGILFEPRALAAGWGKLHEVRELLVRFKKSGKPVVAFLKNPTAREYYVATAADKIYLTSEDLLDLKGLRAQISHYRRTLDKIGLRMEVEHAGKYKDAMDSFTRTSMTPETREVLNAVLDDLYAHLVDTIASARGKSKDQIRKFIDEGPFLARRAKELGLVDGLEFEKQVSRNLEARLKLDSDSRLDPRTYLRGLSTSGRAQRVAFVVGDGTITRTAGADAFGDEQGISAASFLRMLDQVGRDTGIRGVILRVNSPGGDAIASDEILDGVRELSKKKPMVISMSDSAASGGYYISMSGDPVVAYPNTFTGSIGVIFGKVEASELYNKLGIDVETMERGRNAGIDSIHKPLTEEGRRKLQEGIGQVYDTFLDRVAEGRRRKKSEIAPLAEGRVWLGSQAKARGLVDELGGIDRAVELLVAKAKLPADQPIDLVMFPRRQTVFERVFGYSEELVAPTSTVANLEKLARQVGLGAFPLRVFLDGGFLRMAPYSLEIH